MRDALLLVDVLSRFDHDGGDNLLASFRHRLPGFAELLRRARAAGIPVVYANDGDGRWDSDSRRLLQGALAGRGGDAVGAVAPAAGDRLVLKPRYSAFDHTPLVLLLRELDVERLLLGGTATEGCVVQTAIDARELEFKVTIVVDACATVDDELERIALAYAERVAGARLARASELEPGQGETFGTS